MKSLNKRIRRTLAVMLTLAVFIALSACSKGAGEKKDEEAPNTEISETLNVGALNGPTGMGMVELLGNDKIKLTTFQAPDEAVQKIISGDLDIAAVPSNLAPVLYNKTEGKVVALTTICSGVLYIVENGDTVKSLGDLSGKTIIAGGKGGTPEYVLSLLLENAGLKPGADVRIEWMDAHADVAQALMKNDGAVALLPEPFVSNVTAKNDALNIAVDLNKAWTKAFGGSLPMGVVVAKKSVVEERPDDVKAFLTLLGKSVDEVNGASDEVAAKIVEGGFLADAELAKSAIPRCNITCMNPEESKEVLTSFYEKLLSAAPESVGGALPGGDFYYAG